KAWAVTRPNPRAAPVTSATFPLNDPIGTPFSLGRRFRNPDFERTDDAAVFSGSFVGISLAFRSLTPGPMAVLSDEDQGLLLSADAASAARPALVISTRY
ncbi:MAG TPA: hypothetical protein VKA03_01890, partial [Methylovirgula sp.]|nr:hypothetical protein [Methylovirgula sp.]